MATVRAYSRFTQIPAASWRGVNRSDFPFLRYAYLAALEESGAVTPENGWHPHHLGFFEGAQPLAFVPCYLKQHSRGEYVFDWHWADSYHRLGLAYYPKLLCAIPFTPCPGPRWVGQLPGGQNALFEALEQQIEHLELTSWHLLFPALEAPDDVSQNPALIERHDCQFHWHNRGYCTFDDFLAELTAAKRKTIRRERRKVRDAGVEILRIPGTAITEAQLASFYRHYCDTYHCRGQHPYLNLEFFTRLRRTLPTQLQLVQAVRAGVSCGAALFLLDTDTLYGRWWGGDRSIDCLHFEVCYYQGIEYAIDARLARFDPGTQGEHKLIRGFAPTLTRSYHHLRPAGVHQAVRRWARDEQNQVAAYFNAASAALPYAQRSNRVLGQD